MDMAAQVSRRYFELKSEYAVMGAYLLHIGKTNSDKCGSAPLTPG